MRSIMSLENGEIVKIEGKEFYAFAPYDGPSSITGMKIVAKDYLNMSFGDGSNGSAIFSTTRQGSIGYRLRFEYLPTFSEESRSYFASVNWNSGTLGNESSRNVVATVGILNRSEFESNKGYEYYGGPLPRFDTGEWTLTPLTYTGAEVYASYIEPNPNPLNKVSWTSLQTGNTRRVRPALILRSTLMVDDDGNVFSNIAPTIDVPTPPSGSYNQKPTFSYTVNKEGASGITVKEYINGVNYKTTENVNGGTTFTFEPSDLDWLKTPINTTVELRIEANDNTGGVTNVTYNIVRSETQIKFQLKNPFVTDEKGNRILLRLEGSLPEDAYYKIEVCNNAFDDSPTWEDSTNLSLLGLPYPFSNETKTSERWGIGFRVEIGRASSTNVIQLDGLGGAFD